MRLRKFIVHMRLTTLEDVEIDRWILARTRKEAMHVAEHNYPYLVILSVSNPQMPSAAERYWWRFRRFHRPNAFGNARR